MCTNPDNLDNVVLVVVMISVPVSRYAPQLRTASSWLPVPARFVNFITFVCLCMSFVCLLSFVFLSHLSNLFRSTLRWKYPPSVTTGPRGTNIKYPHFVGETLSRSRKASFPQSTFGRLGFAKIIIYDKYDKYTEYK